MIAALNDLPMQSRSPVWNTVQTTPPCSMREILHSLNASKKSRSSVSVTSPINPTERRLTMRCIELASASRWLLPAEPSAQPSRRSGASLSLWSFGDFARIV